MFQLCLLLWFSDRAKQLVFGKQKGEDHLQIDLYRCSLHILYKREKEKHRRKCCKIVKPHSLAVLCFFVYILFF